MANPLQHQARPSVVLETPPAAVPVSGMAWYQQFSEPFFKRGAKHWLHQEIMIDLIPSTLPVPVSGMAWWKPFDQPEQRKYKHYLHREIMISLYPGSLPVPVSGIGWWQAFGQPEQRKVPVQIQHTTFFVRYTPQRRPGGNKAYILQT